MLLRKRSDIIEEDLHERRIGPLDRRIKKRNKKYPERRLGLSDRRIETVDRQILVITGSGEYKGRINLNSAPVRVEHVSNFLIKSDLSFLTLYNTTKNGKLGGVIFINIQDIAVVIPTEDFSPPTPELRKDVDVSVKLKAGYGQINGKIDLLSETREVDRVSGLLNYPEKKWLVVHMAKFGGRELNIAIINMDFISCVTD